MPKAVRYFVRGHCYHLTHRCHDRKYLLRFAKDRHAYREILRQCSREYGVPVLGYCLTSNHVHLLVMDAGPGRTGCFMDALEGDVAQRYNLRKGRGGAFWSGRYHATAIESSGHLWNCLAYIELNMVRAGVVNHPSEWHWCSYGELTGTKQRYRVVDRDKFAEAFGRHPDSEGFAQHYQSAVDERLGCGALSREPGWSDGLAVGSEEFIMKISSLIKDRKRLKTEKMPCASDTRWILREAGDDYSVSGDFKV